MAKHGTMISVLLAGSVAWAQQPGSAPGGPAAQVAKIKVQPDKAPDCSSLKAIAESVTRDCKTNDARAIAIYNFMLLAHYHCPYASEDGGIPALKVIHVYGWGVCGGQCSIMSSLWKQLGWNWRFMGWPGHTTMEAEYDGRWHYLDSFLKIYAWMPDGKGTAKPAAADELQTLPNPFMVGTEPPPAPIVPPAGNDNGEPWKPWLERKLLAPEEAESTMARFVEGQLRELPLPEDAGAWLARRDGLRQEVLAILGIDDLVPPRWELNVQPKGILRREGYRIEKLTFESYPGMAVPALLYIPEAIRGRAPGIVSIAGHAYGTGKTTEHLQQRNVNLVLRGCVVLSYDYIDTGERNTGADPRHGQVYGGGNDHGIRSFSFSRRTPTGLEALDGIRALDLLAARPDVDPERLGFTGESGGSNNTYWVAAVDPRVKLAVAVSSVSTFDYWIRNDRNWDLHQRPFGIRRIADIGTLLALHAPRPMLVISSLRRTDDEEFPFEEADRSVAWAQRVYRLLSAGDAIAHVESSTGHGYQEDKRRHLYAWVERWLEPPSPKGDVELPARVETFEDLRCGLPAGNRTFHDVFEEWLRPLPRTSAQPDASQEGALRRFLRDRLGVPDPLPAVKAEKIGRDEKDRWSAEFWLLEPEFGIRLPGVLLSRKDAEGKIVLVPGRNPKAVASAMAAGHRVFAFDPRGTGEMRDGGGRTHNWAWFAGRSWQGMWALDVIQAARFCRERFSASALLADAMDRFGWPTLLAGAAVPGVIQSGTVAIPFATLRDCLRAQGDAALADVPGLLEYLDVPQIRQLWPEAEVRIQPGSRP